MRTITGYLIDPYARTISAVQLDADEYQQIYPLISRPDDEVQTFEAVTLSNGDVVYVDEEGLLDWEAKGRKFFRLTRPLGNEDWMVVAGKGLWLGCDENGTSMSPKAIIEEAMLTVQFPAE